MAEQIVNPLRQVEVGIANGKLRYTDYPTGTCTWSNMVLMESDLQRTYPGMRCGVAWPACWMNEPSWLDGAAVDAVSHRRLD